MMLKEYSPKFSEDVYKKLEEGVEDYLKTLKQDGYEEIFKVGNKRWLYNPSKNEKYPINSKDWKRYKEIILKYFKFEEKVCKGRLEELRLSDLASNQGASPMSLRFQKQRGKANGREQSNTQLWEMYLLPEGHIDCVFLAKGTEVYPPDTKYSVADRDNNYKLSPNDSHTYIITIRILNAKDWLETHPEGNPITKKDIVEMLDVAEVSIDSQVPSFFWQGACHWLQKLDPTAVIYKKKVKAPQFWNQPQYHGEDNYFLDKITQRVINQYKFFSQQISQMLNKKAKDKGWIK